MVYMLKNLRALIAPTDYMFQIGVKGVEIEAIDKSEAKDLLDLKKSLWFDRVKRKGALTERIVEYEIGKFAPFHTISIFSQFRPSYFLGVFDITIPEQYQEALKYCLKHNSSISNRNDIQTEIEKQFPTEAQFLINSCNLPKQQPWVYQL